MNRRLILGAALLSLGVTGCGGVGSVTGTVTYKPNGKKLAWGTVSMIGRDGILRQGVINRDGTYSVNGVPTGEVKVLVSSENPKATPANSAKAGSGRVDPDAGKRAPRPGEPGAADDRGMTPSPVDEEIVKAWFPIPEKYADMGKSNLTATVKGGPNVHDIILD